MSTMFKGTSGRFRTTAGISLLALAAFPGLQGCIEPASNRSDSNLPGPAARCEVPFDRVISPVQIKGADHLYFNIHDFAFLLDRSTQVQSMTLQLSLSGKKKGSDGEVTLAVNGIRVSNAHPFPIYSCPHRDDARDSSGCHFKLHKMKLNGAEPIHFALARVLKNKGELKLSLHGKDVHILSASVAVKGLSYSSCQNPVPSPTTTGAPSPIPAPATQLTSASPSGAFVASTTMAFEFSSNQSGVSFECSLDGAASSLCSSPQTYSGLSNGLHSFRVFAVNSQGTADPVGASYSWTVQTIPPTVDLGSMSGLPSVTNSSSMTLQFSSASAVSYQCSIDGGAYEPCSSPMTYTGLSEGSHLVQIQGVDAAGNMSMTPASFQWVVDLTAPATTFVSVSPASITNSVSADFGFAASESATFQCSLDGAAYSDCASPVSLGSLSEGEHSFSVVATDLAGNVGQPANYVWTVDTAAPVISLGQVIPAAGLSNSQRVSVEFSANEPASFTCYFDGVPSGDCPIPFAVAVLSEGTHSFQVRATDQAGNTSGLVTVDWVMDFTSPQIAWGVMAPSAASYINSRGFSAEVVQVEAGALACFVNGVSLAGASPVSLSSLAEGAYTVTAQQTDAAGNVGNLLSHSFSVDVTAPVASVTAAVYPGPSSQTTNTFSFSANEAASFQCSLDGAGFSACSSPLSVSGLADGTHVFQVIATDLAGNVGAAAEVSWIVDTTAPVTSLNVSRTTNTSISFSFTSSEAVSAVECSLDGAAFQACSSPVSYSGLSIGSHSFLVRSTDLAGNVELSPARYLWTVLPPITTSITSTSAGVLTNQSAMTIAFSASQPGATFLCSWDGAPAVACTSPASKSGFTAGSHSFVVRAVDSWGTPDSVGATFNWTVDTTPPVVSNLVATVSNSSITITWTTNKPSTSKVNWGQGLATGYVIPEDSNYVTTHSVRINGLTTKTTYSFYVSGHDQAGNAYQSGVSQARTY